MKDSPVCAARWRVSEPGDCSAVCGPGEAKRSVSCVRSEDGQDVEVERNLCSEQMRPPDSVPCVVDVCPIGWESKGEVLLKITKILILFIDVKCPIFAFLIASTCG